MDANTFTTAMMMIWAWEYNTSFSLLEGEMDKNEWRDSGEYTTTANAFYDPHLNTMIIPAAIIQWPFYSDDVPVALNYGNLGMIVGHEISHGFDNRGSEYDSDGRFRNWWKPSTREMFNQKKKCFIEQYSRYKNVNGTITQGENIADNAGIKLAYRAYRSLVAQEETTELVLLGLEEYNSDQLFFLGMGNIWCSRLGNKTMEKIIKYGDPHSPPEFRVNGMSTNMPVFARAFNCTAGTPMNRRGKCELW